MTEDDLSQNQQAGAPEASAPGPATEGTPSAAPPTQPPPIHGYAVEPEPVSSVPPVTPGVPAAPARTGMSAGAVIGIAALVAFLVAAAAGLSAGYVGARLGSGSLMGVKKTTVTVVPRTTDPAVAAAAAAVPSVVNIDVRGKQGSADAGLPNSHPSVPAVANGSGVAYKEGPDGTTYIITNNHVVDNADTLTVRDASGNSSPAKLIGRDPETDIAVVQVKKRIPTIDLGDSKELLVGQTVVAIGSPFGLEHSVTSGVVSALGRSLPDYLGSNDNSYPLIDVIQTDAAINPGNSGGALVDVRGRLEGINTAIYSESGQSGGIGFAVPVNTARRVADGLIAGGEVKHPFIGVIGQSVTKELAKQEKLTTEEGAYVADLAKGSEAGKAGIEIGDVIVKLDGDAVRSMDDLILLVRRKNVGDTVKVTVIRGDQTKTFDVKVGDKPTEVQPSSSPHTSTPTPRKK